MNPKKFGVIGHPIAHSLSKQMHEAVFKELSLPHTYDKIDVAPENLEQFIKTTDLDGINVTIPHKVEIMKHLDQISDEAKQIQAVNTIHNNEGYNTDAFGFSESLKEEGIELQNKNVLVIGAGGASRAILISLRNNNANITITNRTKQKAIDLNEKLNLNAKVIDYQQLTTSYLLPPTDLIVNTTSIGMHPNENKSPIPKQLLKPNHVIFDAIYNPLKTKLIKDAESIGCKTISGVNMLVHQGAQSLRIWLGIEPPIQVMKNEVLKKLAN
jgi:shikimate dehydrogenase